MHTPSVRGREGLWHRDYRRARSLRAPKPEGVVPRRGRVPAAAGRAHVERETVPPAAAQDGLISGCRPLRITSRAVLIVVLAIPISHPFPDVPGHVVCAIGALPALIASNGCSIAIAIIGCTVFPFVFAVRITKIRQPPVELVPPWVAPPICAARGFFPFRLGGQAFPSPGAIRFRVLLAYLHYWMLFQPCDATAWTPRCAPVGTVDLLDFFSIEDIPQPSRSACVRWPVACTNCWKRVLVTSYLST
jgi:hypothetical protein